jgi:glycosyltransferase involved in cell wall biosynthesis
MKKKVKVAIYDKWLHTYGGAEKVATVMANLLSKKPKYDVDLISNFDVDKNELENMMGVDLSKVKLRPWYHRSYHELVKKSKKYDLLVNVSFLDHMPSDATKSIYYVHFPTPIKKTFLGFIKYETILPMLRRYLIIPQIREGLSPLDDVYTRGGRWLGRDNEIVFSNTPGEFRLTLRVYVEQYKVDTIELLEFSSPNSEIYVEDKYVEQKSNVLVYKIKVESESRYPVMKVKNKINLKTNALGLVSMTIRSPRYFLWNLIKRYLPRYEMALYGSQTFRPDAGLDTYDLFLANSNFTKKWTKRYLDKQATLLYPPVDVHKFKPGKKRKIILNVGRFFVGGHSKRQDVLLDAFIELCDSGDLRGWELHFVGGVASGQEHTKYLNDLRKKAEGYPVEFHLFASFKTLKRLYSEARLYWHATGFGVDKRTQPIKLEHFGITVVESMASGCVPVVFGGGGLTETVGKDSGLIWNKKEQLKSITKDLIEDNKRTLELSVKYQKISKKYSRDKFGNRFLKLIEDLLNENEKA